MSALRPVASTFALFLVAACASPADTSPSDAAVLATWMTGSFSSAAQAAEQPDDYFDIRLFTVAIWPERQDGAWLYVEQSAAESLERPYRQRVYHVVDTPDGARSDVYELPGDPLEYAGAWRRPAQFDGIGPANLRAREGCSIYLVRSGDAFRGATTGSGCASRLRGAAYATSEVTVTAAVLTSWDRGFDADGVQVWGAENGPYAFVRQP